MAQYHVTGDYPETTSYGTEVFLAKMVCYWCDRYCRYIKRRCEIRHCFLKSTESSHGYVNWRFRNKLQMRLQKKLELTKFTQDFFLMKKLAKLQEQRSKHGAVMFVGDGINDAPVLAGADCGAAMGSGADAAIEAADVVFMTSNVEAIPQAISIGKKACKIAWQNVVFALAIKALVMILGLLGFANMWMAVFADSGVAMLCVINSIRAMKL